MFKLQHSLDVSKGAKVIKFRNIKKIDKDQFSYDLTGALTDLNSSNSCYHMAIDNFNKTCKSILDSHAPEMTKTINDIPEAPWFDGEYKVARIERRRAEKEWRKTNLEIDHSIFLNLRQHCDELSLQKKKQFFKENF